jgi:large subunit ribosomal protein L6
MKNIESLFYHSKLKIPSQVSINKIKESLFFEGPLGCIDFNIKKLDNHAIAFFNIGPEIALRSSNAVLTQDLTADSKAMPLFLEIFVLKNSKKAKAFFGSLEALCLNALNGVSQGYLVYLELIGVGFRVLPYQVASQNHEMTTPPVKERIVSMSKSDFTESKLELKLGQSHPLYFMVPSTVRIFILKPTLLCIYGIQKHEVNQVVANLKDLKSPDAYKGKGIRIRNSIFKLKVGKKK